MRTPRVGVGRLRFGVAHMLAGVALVLAATRVASAQALPESPISVANGRLVIGGDVTATIGPDDPGFFNYTTYAFNALRNFRLATAIELKASRYLHVLGEVRFDQGRVLEAYGVYARIRPWPERRFDIQAGRIPPTFGAMTRSAYGNGNLLIGQPLAYQYLSSIRADALPATTDDLLRMRGRGWLSSFPIGSTVAAPGLPIVNTSRWDTGIAVHGIAHIVEWTGSVTAGTLSDPQFHDNNDGRQFAGRVVVKPAASVALGLSASHGEWIGRALQEQIAGTAAYEPSTQVALGTDAEYSAGHLLVRGEVIRSAWHMPAMSTLQLDGPLRALSTLVEGRYRLLPGLSLAMRGDRLTYSTITGTRGTNTWDAITWRAEAGVSYSVRRNVVAKVSVQRNRRDGGRVRRDTLTAAQVLYWF